MKAPKNYKRVQHWLSGVTAGRIFTSQTVAKAENLTGADVGNILKWQDNVQKLPKKLPGNIIQWQKVEA